MNDIISTIKSVLSEPTACWSKISRNSVKDSASYLLVLMLVFGVLSWLVSLMWTSPMLGMFGMGASWVLGLVMTLVGLVFGLVLMFVNAWLYNLIIGFLGVDGEFKDAFNALVHGATPNLLLGWIPFVNILTMIWSLVLAIVGLKEIYNTDYAKVIIAMVIEIVILAVVWVLLGATLVMWFMGQAGGFN